MTLESGIAAAEVEDPAKAAFLAAFKADLASPSAFQGSVDLPIFPDITVHLRALPVTFSGISHSQADSLLA